MFNTITINERRYTVEIEPDFDQTAPWDNEDGHGPVSNWTRSGKAPGQLVLNEDRDGSKRYYDFAEACRIAKRDGWGWIPEPVRVERPIGYRLPTYRCGDFKLVSDDANEAYSAIYAHFRESMTAKEYAAKAAMADYERLRGWCNDGWQYVAVIVTDDESGEFASLGGIESDCGDYLAEVAQELAEELNAQWEASRRNACLLAYEG